MAVSAMKGVPVMDKKTVKISEKRQFAIPQKFFTMLGFDREAECFVQNNELVIRPIKKDLSGEFAAEILADLLDQGVSRENLLEAFKAKQAMVRPAVENMIQAAEQAASGDGEFETYDDVFNSEDPE